MKAVWNGTVLAESDKTIVVDGHHYFPPETIHREYFKQSQLHTVCPWKGTASYYDVVVGGETNSDAAWYYPETLEAAAHFRGYVAFWNGIDVCE